MSNLITADELASALTMHPVTVRKWTREGRIKPELLIGRSPRFNLSKVRKQLVKATEARSADKFKGMVPTL